MALRSKHQERGVVRLWHSHCALAGDRRWRARSPVTRTEKSRGRCPAQLEHENRCILGIAEIRNVRTAQRLDDRGDGIRVADDEGSRSRGQLPDGGGSRRGLGLGVTTDRNGDRCQVKKRRSRRGRLQRPTEFRDKDRLDGEACQRNLEIPRPGLPGWRELDVSGVGRLLRMADEDNSRGLSPKRGRRGHGEHQGHELESTTVCHEPPI